MTREELHTWLCPYDTRSPEPVHTKQRKDCCCDPCTYGTHKLADLALDLMDAIDAFQHREDLADRDRE